MGIRRAVCRLGLLGFALGLLAVPAHAQQPAPGTAVPPNRPPSIQQQPEVREPPITAPEPDRRRGVRNQPVEEELEPGVTRIGTGARTPNSRRALTIVPGVAVGYEGSDNIDRLPAGERNSGGVAEITPFVGIEWHRPGSDLSLGAALRTRQFFDSAFADQRLDGDVNGNGDVALIGDGLRLRGSGRLFRLQGNGTTAGGTGLLGGSRTRESAIFRNLLLSPYLIGDIGTNAEYETGYEYELVEQTRRSDSNRVYADVQANFGNSEFGLNSRADLRFVEYENGFDYQNFSALLGVNRSFAGRLKIGLGAYFSRIDELRNADGDDSGIGPALYWDWRPTERSVLQGQYADAYYGDSAAVRFRQLYSRWLLSASWRKDIEDGNRATTLLFRPLRTPSRERRRSSGNERLQEFDDRLAERDLDLDEGAELFVTSLDTALIYDDTISIGAASVLPRSAAILSLFHSDRSSAVANFASDTTTDALQYGAYLVYDLSFTARNSWRLVGAWIKSEFTSRGQQATGSALEMSWRYKLTSRASVRFIVRRTEQEGTGELFTFVENAAGILYTYEFR